MRVGRAGPDPPVRAGDDGAGRGRLAGARGPAQPAGTSGVIWQVPLAIAFLVPLLRRPPVAVSGLLKYIPVLPLLLVVADLRPSFTAVQFGALVAISAAGLVWLAVDERVALTLGLLLTNGVLTEVAFVVETSAEYPAAQMIVPVAFAAVVPAVLLGLGVTAARRQARL